MQEGEEGQKERKRERQEKTHRVERKKDGYVNLEKLQSLSVSGSVLQSGKY